MKGSLALTTLPFLLLVASSTAFYETRCCYDSDSVPLKDCVCLENNVQTETYELQEGKELYFHWRLKDISYVNVPDHKRQNITFMVLPCSGSMHLFVQPLKSNFSVVRKETHWYNSTYSKDWNEVHIPLVYSDYYVVVFAEKAGNFSLLTAISDYVIPRPGNFGLIEVNQTQHYSVEVSFYSPPIHSDIQKNIGELLYTVYYYTYDKNRHMHACKNATDVELCYRAHILWTPCGLHRSSPKEIKTVAYKSDNKLPEATANVDGVQVLKHSVTFHDLPLEKQLFFNVLVHATNHSISMSYRGVQTSLYFGRVYTSLGNELIFSLTLSMVYTLLLATAICVCFQWFVQYDMHKSVMADMRASYLKSLKSSDKEITTKVSAYIAEETKDSDLAHSRDSDMPIGSPDGSDLINESEYVFSEDESSPNSPGSPLSPASYEGSPASFGNDMDRSPAKSDADILEELLVATSPSD